MNYFSGGSRATHELFGGREFRFEIEMTTAAEDESAEKDL